LVLPEEITAPDATTTRLASDLVHTIDAPFIIDPYELVIAMFFIAIRCNLAEQNDL
jgi:hypothetical protein